MLAPGTLLGDRYEIIEKIGAGGMSIVYKAKCQKLQRFVAIKVLREEFVKDEEFVAKFRKEALAAASLSHPNIVGIYDVGSDNDLHYIVMECIDGKTLKDVILEKGPFSTKVVLDYGMQIVSALRHAHRKKIIHRDIKSQNILVTNDNVIKVTDFGIAKAVDSSTVVATGNAIGSVHYFSPEQAKGKYVNEASDLYSCGVVLFELATKRLPYEAESHISIALKHINEDFPKPSEFHSDIATNVEQIILKATRKSQVERYQNADEMLADMKGALHSPNYVIQDKLMDDHTILLSDVETDMIRNQSMNESLKQEEGTGKEEAFLNEEEPDDISTTYKVLVSIAGVLITLVLVGVLSTVLVIGMPSFGNSKKVDAPSLIGKTVEEATELVEAKKLKIAVVQEKEVEDALAGTIIEQTPGENEKVKIDTIIEVVVAKEEESEPIDEVEVPQVLDLDSGKAQTELKNRELTFDIQLVYDDKVPEDKVIAQVPAAYTKVAKGTKVMLKVSKGPEVVLANVPNLYNMTVESATISLERENLQLGEIKKEESESIAEGLIIDQDIPPNKQVETGSKVNIIVSKGKPEEEPKPTPPALVQKTHTIFAPGDKDSYHVMMTLITESGSRVVFDQNVKKEEFPLTVDIQGRGVGTLETYFDGATQPTYQDPIDFSGV